MRDTWSGWTRVPERPWGESEVVGYTLHATYKLEIVDILLLICCEIEVVQNPDCDVSDRYCTYKKCTSGSTVPVFQQYCTLHYNRLAALPSYILILILFQPFRCPLSPSFVPRSLLPCQAPSKFLISLTLNYLTLLDSTQHLTQRQKPPILVSSNCEAITRSHSPAEVPTQSIHRRVPTSHTLVQAPNC